jgi:hypothetical protein
MHLYIDIPSIAFWGADGRPVHYHTWYGRWNNRAMNGGDRGSPKGGCKM